MLFDVDFILFSGCFWAVVLIIRKKIPDTPRKIVIKLNADSDIFLRTEATAKYPTEFYWHILINKKRIKPPLSTRWQFRKMTQRTKLKTMKTQKKPPNYSLKYKFNPSCPRTCEYWQWNGFYCFFFYLFSFSFSVAHCIDTVLFSVKIEFHSFILNALWFAIKLIFPILVGFCQLLPVSILWYTFFGLFCFCFGYDSDKWNVWTNKHIISI